MVAGEERSDVRSVAREFALLAGSGVVCHGCAGSVARSHDGQSVAWRRVFVGLADFYVSAVCRERGRFHKSRFATCLLVVREGKTKKLLICSFSPAGQRSYFVTPPLSRQRRA